MSPTFTVVIPVKAPERAKTRLTIDGLDRGTLFRAFALDAIEATVAADRVARVVVVTDDDGFAEEAAALGAEIVPDEGGGELNTALLLAVRRCAPAGAVAAMCADLPCLDAAEVDEALALLASGGFVADHVGTGTTLLAAPRADLFAPSFGPGSRLAHEASGLRDVAATVARLRLDVDTAEDLALARALGLGPRTRAVTGSPAHTSTSRSGHDEGAPGEPGAPS